MATSRIVLRVSPRDKAGITIAAKRDRVPFETWCLEAIMCRVKKAGAVLSRKVGNGTGNGGRH